MTDAQQEVESAIGEAERLRRALRRGKGRQVSGDDERTVVRATALTWFNTHRPAVVAVLGETLLKDVDNEYRNSLTATDKASLRTRHLNCLRKIKNQLSKLQSDHVVILSSVPSSTQQSTSNLAPQFSPLVTDSTMQKILANRWNECVKCVSADAPLAATVMMGGLLEALLLARITICPTRKSYLPQSRLRKIALESP